MDLPIEYEPYHRFIKRKAECSNEVWGDITRKYLPTSFDIQLSFDGACVDDYIALDKYNMALSDWIRVHCTGLWSCDSLREGFWNGGKVRFYFQDNKSAVLFKLKYNGV